MLHAQGQTVTLVLDSMGVVELVGEDGHGEHGHRVVDRLSHAEDASVGDKGHRVVVCCNELWLGLVNGQ